jgi:putative FmdB family regulatory protein
MGVATTKRVPGIASYNVELGGSDFMPLYEYACGSCGVRFERIRKFSDPPLTVCPECGGVLEKLISSPAIQFKGSGFYITDYARSGQKSEGSADGAGGKGASGKGSEGSESSSKDAGAKETASKDAGSKDSGSKDSASKESSSGSSSSTDSSTSAAKPAATKPS